MLDDGKVVADIVDPHGLYLADALPKLQGLALYAEAHAKAYRRIESVAEIKGKLRVLDLTREDVRKAIATQRMRRVCSLVVWPVITNDEMGRGGGQSL